MASAFPLLTPVDAVDYAGGPASARMRHCDLCHLSLCSDRPPFWRAWYVDEAEGLTVCGHCAPTYRLED